MITLDTSGLFALLNRRDPRHAITRASLLADRGPYLVPVAILSEIGYLVESRLGLAALDAFLQDVERGAFLLECGAEDVARIRHLVLRYADLPLGLADAAVIVCAQRHGGRVLTLDRRDFDVVGRDVRLRLVPEL